MNRSRCLGGAVAADAAGEGELLEETPQPFLILTLVRIDLRINALQVNRAKHAGSAVTGTRHEDHVEIVTLDDPVQMCVNEREGRAGSPMPEHTISVVLRLEWFAKKRIILQINHPQGQIIAGPPKCMSLAQLLRI